MTAAEFFTVWTEFYPAGRDWNDRAMAEGRSSLGPWLEWACGHAAEKLRSALVRFADQGDRPPSLYQVKRMMGEAGLAGPRQQCRTCGGLTTVPLVQDARTDRVITASYRLSADSRPTITAVPCQDCERGRQLDDQVSTRAFASVFRAEVTTDASGTHIEPGAAWSAAQRYLEQCRSAVDRSAGAPVREDRPEVAADVVEWAEDV